MHYKLYIVFSIYLYYGVVVPFDGLNILCYYFDSQIITTWPKESCHFGLLGLTHILIVSFF